MNIESKQDNTAKTIVYFLGIARVTRADTDDDMYNGKQPEHRKWNIGIKGKQ